jgi:hypothetical protein
MEAIAILTSAATGAVGGAIYGYSAYQKNKAADAKEQFDAKLFAVTVGVSALAGILVQFAGGDISTTTTALESAGVTVILQKIYGAICK